MASRFPLLLSFSFFFSTVAAFSFTFRTPSECDDLGLTWTGGTPPFQLGIVPIYGTPRSIDIPSSAFVSGRGSFSIPLPLKRDQEGLLIMSDATGFNAGGSSNVFKVLASQGGVCNSTDPGIAFSFQLNSALQQCRPYVFSGYDGAIQPVTIAAVIPGGNGVLLNPPVGDPSYSWTVNVAQGTSMIFFMTDSRGRQGGSSDVRIVGVSDDNTCLSPISPVSTVNPPGPSKTTTSNTSAPLSNPSSTPSQTSSPSIPPAGIAGAIVGSVIFLTVAVTLALFVLKRASNPQKRRIESQTKFDEDGGQSSQDRLHGVSPSATPTPATRLYDSNQYYRNSTLLPPQPYATDNYQPSSASLTGYYDPSMSLLPPSSVYPPQPNYRYSTHSSAQSSSVDARPSDTPSLLPYAQPTTASQPSTHRPPSSNGSGSAPKPKAAMAGTFLTPSRFVVHTDVEDGLVPNADGVVELPPQYSAMRAPIRLEPPPPGSYS